MSMKFIRPNLEFHLEFNQQSSSYKQNLIYVQFYDYELASYCRISHNVKFKYIVSATGKMYNISAIKYQNIRTVFTIGVSQIMHYMIKETYFENL